MYLHVSTCQVINAMAVAAIGGVKCHFVVQVIVREILYVEWPGLPSSHARSMEVLA